MSSSNGTNGIPSPPNHGGIGGAVVVDPRTTGQDIRLIRRAIIGGWNVPQETKELVVNTMALLVNGKKRNDDGAIIPDDDVGPRERARAAAVLALVDGIDQRTEAKAVAAPVAVSNTFNTQINVNNYTSADDLAKLPADELAKVHRQSLSLPLADQDEVPGKP